MDKRKQILLNHIIKEYINSASPIGSKFLEDKSRLGVSSATIRNEMAELEAEGYIIQPHTSAGRIPTEKGYKFYLTEIIDQGKLNNKDKQDLAVVIKKLETVKSSTDVLIKELARRVADISDNAVVAAFSPNNIYYTGISNLFKQPEFANNQLVYSMSLIIDHLDRVVEEVYNDVKTVDVYLGKQNPFGNDCGVVIGPWQFQKQRGIMAILGPVRMNYEKSLGLINYLSNNV